MGDTRNRPVLKIGELAKRFGLNVRTLRYYETLGLLPAPARSEGGGYRLYSEADAERLSFVLRAKRTGFSLDEIGEVLRLGRHGKACGYVRGKLAEHIARVDAELQALTSLRAELARAQAAWDGPQGSAVGTVCGLIEGWAPSAPPQVTNKESVSMATAKRNVEVFTAGCPLCDPVVKLVQEVACDGCEVTVHNLNDAQAAERARAAGVNRVPMVLVDGKPAGCCTAASGAVTEEGLRAAGVGAAR